MAQIIYVLTHPYMPGLVKIGKTTDLVKRLRDLNNTSVPVAFECAYAVEVKDMSLVEKKLHFAFGKNRVRQEREFFEIEPERIVSVLELLAIQDVTPREDIVEDKEDKQALEKIQARKRSINLELIGVKVGDTLSFIRDDSILCKVIKDNEVEFEGERYSLSSLASKLLKERFGRQTLSARGPLYWLFEGETLAERRERMEESNA